jgi:hypothetical protein
MANTTGYRDTNTVESTILARDIRKAILEYDKDVTPLLVITSNIGLGSQKTQNPKVEWYERDREVRRDTSTTTGTGTTLAVTDGTLWKPEEVWRNTRTGEGFRVVSISTNNVTVARNLDAAGAVACVSGDEYIKVGVAKMEGDTEREAYGGNPTARYNYTQIFERTYAMTRTMNQTATYTSPQNWDDEARHAMSEFKIDKEMAYLFGPGPGLDTSGAHPRRVMRGVHPSITTNVKDFGGTMTESEFWDAYDQAFRYPGAGGGNTKIAISGRTPISVISGFPRGKLEVINGSDSSGTYGVSVSKFRHNFGTLNFITHNLFNDSTVYAKQVLILDVEGTGGDTLVQERFMEDTNITPNVQENGRDGRKDKILCESTITLGLEKAHSKWIEIGA